MLNFYYLFNALKWNAYIKLIFIVCSMFEPLCKQVLWEIYRGQNQYFKNDQMQSIIILFLLNEISRKNAQNMKKSYLDIPLGIYDTNSSFLTAYKSIYNNQEYKNGLELFLGVHLMLVQKQPCKQVTSLVFQIFDSRYLTLLIFASKIQTGHVSLLTVPLTDYCNGKIANCLFLKTTIKTALSQSDVNCCF